MKEQSHTGHFLNNFAIVFYGKLATSVSGIMGYIYATEILQIVHIIKH